MMFVLRSVPVLLLAPFVCIAAPCLHYDVPDFSLIGHLRETSNDYAELDLEEPICLIGNEATGNLAKTKLLHIPLINGPSVHVAGLSHKRVNVTGHFMPTLIPHYHETAFYVSLIREIPQRAPN